MRAIPSLYRALPGGAILLLLGCAAASAAEPPAFDVERGCRAAASRGDSGVDAQVCITSERRAERQLRDQWDQFAEADRKTCIPLTRTGGMPTYSELVTCLETARDARRLRAKNDDGLGTGLDPRGTIGGGPARGGSSGTVSPSGVPSASPGGTGAGSGGAGGGAGGAGGSGGGAGGGSM